MKALSATNGNPPLPVAMSRELSRKFERLRDRLVKLQGAELSVFVRREDGAAVYVCPFCAQAHAVIEHANNPNVRDANTIRLSISCVMAPEHAALIVMTREMLEAATF